MRSRLDLIAVQIKSPEISAGKLMAEVAPTLADPTKEEDLAVRSGPLVR